MTSSGYAPGPPDGQVLAATGQGGQTIGLASATALVIGSIIGTGVFTMPAVLASAGTSSLAVVAVGAVLLAVLFGQLTRRVPRADGGPLTAPRRTTRPPPWLSAPRWGAR